MRLGRCPTFTQNKYSGSHSSSTIASNQLGPQQGSLTKQVSQPGECTKLHLYKKPHFSSFYNQRTNHAQHKICYSLLISGSIICVLNLKFCREAWVHVFQRTQKVFWEIPPKNSFIKIINYF